MVLFLVECFVRPSSRGHGTGKYGSIIKIDFVRSLIRHLFAGDPEVTEAEQERMIQAIAGASMAQQQKVKCPEDVIQARELLGREAEDFRFIHDVALNQQAVEKEAKKQKPEQHGPRASSTRDDAYAKRTYTPAELRKLLPPSAWCNRQPVLKRYQCGYAGLQVHNLLQLLTVR